MLKLTNTPEGEKVKYNYQTIDKGHHKVYYRGIQAQRSPFDYVMYQMIIAEVEPDLIIEIGTNFGGGALYMADLLNNLGRGEVHSIDITDKCAEIVKQHLRIKLFHEGFEKYDLELAKGFKKIIVIEDASHTYEDSLSAVNKFAGVVTKDSYLIVEDGVVDKLGVSKAFNGGPCKAIREFLPKHPEFIVDRKWCDFFGKNATNNVNGYLKKIR
jgi:cephalosporin hydroxylase